MPLIDDLHRLRESVRRRGAPEAVCDWMERLARPQLRLRFQELAAGDETRVVGYAGGRPMLPDEVEWPALGPGYVADASLEFVAAVDCAALPVGALDIPMPDMGTLLFFLDLWAYPGDTDASTVIYVPAGTPVSERTRPGGSNPSLGVATPLLCELRWSLPEGHAYEFQILSDESRTLFLKYQGTEIEPPYSIWDGGRYDESSPHEESVYGRMCSLMLGGHAWTVQDDPLIGRLPDGHPYRPVDGMPQELADAAAAKRPNDLPLPQDVYGEHTPVNGEWLLLAQLATDADGEGHVFSWTIRREDLIDRRFDRVQWHRAS